MLKKNFFFLPKKQIEKNAFQKKFQKANVPGKELLQLVSKKLFFS